MNQYLLYFASALIAVAVGYFTNQLPNLPDNLKPWMPSALGVLILIGAVVAINLSNSGATAKTKIRGNRMKGNKNSIRATNGEVDRNKIDGDDNVISTNDRDPGSQP